MKNSNAMTVKEGGKGKIGIPLPPTLDSLRQKLYQKAKNEPKFRFYTLYAHVHRDDVLETAWKLVKRNGGAAGIDGVRISDIVGKEGGVEELLAELKRELKEKKYKPRAVRRVYIDKPGGGRRPLGIPAVRDRVVQAAARLVIEPIFEVDFEDCSYGFRPGRSAHDALRQVQEYLKQGYREVYDIDLKSYFDSIPHDKLMKCLEMRIADRSMLKLIRLWLKAAVVEEIGGGKKRTTRSDKGTPQGSVISPLLSNAYLHWFDKVFGRENAAKDEPAKLVRYADDLLVFARQLTTELRSFVDDKLETWLELELNRDKTQIVQLKDGSGSVDFLGFTFRFDRDLRGRPWHYLNTTPSAKTLKRERRRLKEMTSKQVCFVPTPELIQGINQHLACWTSYFQFGYPRHAFRHLNSYVRRRLTQHLRRRSQRPFRPPAGVSYCQHLDRLGLVYL